MQPQSSTPHNSGTTRDRIDPFTPPETPTLPPQPPTNPTLTTPPTTPLQAVAQNIPRRQFRSISQNRHTKAHSTSSTPLHSSATLQHGGGRGGAGGLPECPAVGTYIGAASLLRGAPFLPHQELHRPTRSPQAHPRPHEVQAHLPRPQ